MSYANMVLLGATLPSYRSKGSTDNKDDKPKGESKLRDSEEIDGDDPANAERISKIFDEFE